MRQQRSSWIWTGRIAAVVVLAGLAAYLFSVGLDKADKLASVLVLLVAVATLVAPYLLPVPAGDHSESRSSQHVANTVVKGNLTQARGAKAVRVRSPIAPGTQQADPPRAAPVPEDQDGQYVNGVWIGGNLTQVDGADGDVTIR
jgi:hypothetical protein